jgi:rifampicin phosphotransferase
MSIQTPLTFSFDDPLALTLKQTGGKGANLARLTQHGFSVPDGFIITASGYQRFAAAAQPILAAFDALDAHDQEGIAALCESTARQLAAMSLPASLEEAIEAAVAKLQARVEGPLMVSVRSSSTLEDLDSAAFAGQHDTFLNVTPRGVGEHAKRCFISLWHHRAVAYRLQQGFAPTSASMAVVVQRMVNAESSGVAFCINPISGALDEVVIDANFGLGESVVSGEVSVDHYRISKRTLEVLERHVGLKEHKVVSTDEGVAHVEIADGEGVEALDAARLRAVATLAMKVEQSYGFPQDIEWAIDAQGDLQLLQARPITRFPPHWTRDESAERFPNAMTPLGWEFADEGFHRSLKTSLALMNMAPFHGRWFAMFDNYIYGNQNAVKLILGGRALRFKTVEELSALLPGITARCSWAMTLPATWMRDLDRYLLSLGRLRAKDLLAMSLDERWAQLMEIDVLGNSYFAPNIAISMTHGLMHKLLFDALCLFMPMPEAKGSYDALTRYCETKTSLVNKELYTLSMSARTNPALASALTSMDSQTLYTSGQLRERFPEFAARFAQFVEDHGHREVDPDPFEPFWADAPWVVLDTIGLLLKQEQVADPSENEFESKTAQHDAEVALYQKVPQDLRFFFAEVTRLARVYSSLDDVEHYQTTRLQRLFRQTVLSIGDALVARGVIETACDVFFGSRATLKAYVESPTAEHAAALGDLIKNQRAAYQENRAKAPRWDLQTDPTDPETVDYPDGMRGIPGAPGFAQGEVFIVRSVDDFPRFPEGAVLVARTTNPSWTPLFYSASAVITEAGGPLSHGAITAREMGIPAVMAVRSCTSALSNGDRVRVDGNRGLVHLEPAS